jgi:lambda repressor-like predicted transcriptional regulator
VKTVRDSKGRPLTEAEVERLRSIPFASAPPWTTERTLNNARLRRVIAELYLDGVSMATLAEAVGMSTGAMNQQILKARRAGLLSAPRRVVTRASRRAVKPLKHRPLTHGEGDILRYYYGNVKAYGDYGSRWQGAPGEAMVDYMRWLQADGVTLTAIGEAIGLSRERVRQVLRDVEVTPLPDI